MIFDYYDYDILTHDRQKVQNTASFLEISKFFGDAHFFKLDIPQQYLLASALCFLWTFLKQTDLYGITKKSELKTF